ncbi:MAG TPA: FprA family A-type flavoprotein, partial [Firmicutes bacterium]|nr:FprA family A-type flavoprotein [Bacillota bacterium]
MAARKLRDGIFAVGAIDWDRRLFDELVPLPEGTSYNAYLVRGATHTALLDTVDPTMTGVLLANLEQLGVTRLDYVVAHHAEQDHSGSLPAVLARYPEARVVTNPKAKDFLNLLLDLPADRWLAVDDRETLDLGGKTLQFHYAPWVHWPETMFTYLPEDRTLFTCDFLGAHVATSELIAADPRAYREAAKRYYAEIMMPFRPSLKSHLQRLAELEIDLLAPSHGPVYDRPEEIIAAYRDWASDAVHNLAVVAYASMHGSTRRMIEHLADALLSRGIAVELFDLARTDVGRLAMALVDAATVVLGSPTVLAGAHPLVAHAAYLVNALRPKTRFAAIVGSYAWGGKMVDQLTGLMPNLKAELLEPVVAKGRPMEAEFAALDRLADALLER